MLLATFSPGYSMVALAQHCIRQKDCVHEGENVTVSGVQMNCTSPGSGKWGLSRYRSERHSWGSHIYLQKWTEPGHAHLCIWGAGTPWACQICCTYTVQPASTCLGNSKYSENVIKGEGELKVSGISQVASCLGDWHQGAVMQVQDKPHALGVFSCTLGPEYMLNCTCTETAAGHTEIPSK